MPMLLRLLATCLLGTATLTAVANDHTHAHSHASEAQTMDITQVWSRAMPPSAPTGAVYFSLHNPTGQADRLTGAHTTRAERAELHTHVHEGDMMRMEQVEAVDVPARSEEHTSELQS